MTKYYETLQRLIKRPDETPPPPQSLEELLSYPGTFESKLSLIEERIKNIEDQYDRIYFYQQELLRASKEN